MFKLIRDKIPELAKKDGQVVNYATAENDELYIILLKIFPKTKNLPILLMFSRI